jgi:hypothetical protein
MSFQITQYTYDSTRKLPKLQQISKEFSPTDKKFMYMPAPYNLSVNLYILTKTQEDGLQLVEQILPTFVPEWTIPINAVPEMNIIHNIPVILNSIEFDDTFEGDFQVRRFITHTLSFTLKINLYAPLMAKPYIKHTTATIATPRGTSSSLYSSIDDYEFQSVTDSSQNQGNHE